MKALFGPALFLLPIVAYAQVGIGTVSPAPSAAIDISSTTKGFLPPRMSWAQIQAIPNPAIGLAVFDVGAQALRVYTTNGWTLLAPRQSSSLTEPDGVFQTRSLASPTGFLSPQAIKPSKVNPSFLYMAGYFSGTYTFGSFTLTSNGAFADIFFAKLDSSGAPVWVKTTGGTSQDRCLGLDVDAFDNLYLGGDFVGSCDFNPTATNTGFTSLGGTDGWYARYDSTGALKWVRRIGGSNTDVVADLAVNGAFVYPVGSFAGTASFNTTSMISEDGTVDGWVARYDTSTGNLGASGWVRQMIDSPDGKLLCVIPYGNSVAVGGHFAGKVTLPALTPLTRLGHSFQDGYAVILDNAGLTTSSNVISIWAGAAAYVSSIINALATDATGALYYGGEYVGTANLHYTSTIQFPSAGSSDGFVVKISSGGAVEYMTKFGGTGTDAVQKLVAENGEVTLAGRMETTATFAPPTTSLTTLGQRDIVLARLTTTGGVKWVGRAGSTTFDELDALTLVPGRKTLWVMCDFGAAPFLDFGGEKHSTSDITLVRYEE